MLLVIFAVNYEKYLLFTWWENSWLKIIVQVPELGMVEVEYVRWMNTVSD